MFMTLSVIFFVAGVIVTWFVVVRPVVNSDHFQRMRAHGATVLEAFKRFRTMAIAKLLMLCQFLVMLYDAITPLVMGIDWNPLTSQIPPWTWPILLFATSALFAWLRTKTTTAPAEPTHLFASGRQQWEVEG